MKKFPLKKLALILLISIFSLCVPAVLSACGISYLVSSCILAQACTSASQSCGEEQTTISYELTKDGDAYKVIRVGVAINDVVIPETYEGLPVTTIAEGAFIYSSFYGHYTSSFNSLTLPSSITTIEECAFSLPNSLGYYYGSSSFNKVYFNGSIEEYFNIYMGDRLLYYTETLYIDNEEVVDLVIPDGITDISPNAFAYYFGLNSVTLSQSLKTIGDDAFYYCANLQSLTLSENIQTIGDRAFYECRDLSSPLNFSKNLLSIGEYAFWNSGISQITFHEDSFLLIKENAFYGCAGIDSLNIPQGVRLGAGAFEDCTQLQSLKIASPTISRAAFNGCISLSKIEFADTVTSIDEAAFSECWSLETLDLSQTQVQSIGEYAFEYCRLHLVYLPQTLQNINLNCFLNNPRLYEIYNLSNIEFPKNSTVVYNAKVIHTSLDEPLQVECREGWYFFNGDDGVELFACEEYILLNYNVNLPETEHDYTLTSGIFNDAYIWTVVIPSCVTAIGDNAFNNCGGLFEITFSEGLKSIGEYAFAKCPSIYKIILPKGLESVGDYAFAACPSLQYVDLPEGLISLGEGAFLQSTLKTVIMPSTLKVIGKSAFAQTELLQIDIPGAVTEIGKNAFSGCKRLTSIKIGEGVQDFNFDMFSFCTSLSELHLPKSLDLSKLLPNNFAHSSYGFTIYYNGTVEEWKQSASAEFSQLNYTIICSNGTVEYL